MPLFHRVARLFLADCHALLDHLEAPDILLRQALREMHDELDALRARERTAGEHLRRTDCAIAACESELARIEEELTLCLDAGQEALARHLVARKLDSARRHADLSALRTRQVREQEALISAIVEADAAQDELVRAAEPWLQQPFTECQAAAPPVAVTPADIEIALLQEKQRRGRI